MEKNRKDIRTPDKILADVEHDRRILGEYKELYGVEAPKEIYEALQEQLEKIR